MTLTAWQSPHPTGFDSTFSGSVHDTWVTCSTKLETPQSSLKIAFALSHSLLSPHSLTPSRCIFPATPASL